MFKNVLVGVDGRENGRDATALALCLVDPDGQLTFAHVHPGAHHPLHAVEPGVVREEQQASEELLVREREAADVDARLASVVATSTARGLHEQAELQGADLLVVGSSSRGFIGRTLLGNDARAALNGASCAAAIAALGFAEHPHPFARIGVGYDHSPESEAALAAARRIAEASRASLHAVRVVGIPTYSYAGGLPVVPGDLLDNVLEVAKRDMPDLPGVETKVICGLGGEEGRVRGRGRPARGGLARLRPGQPAALRQHVRLPRAPRSLLAARAASLRGPRAGRRRRCADPADGRDGGGDRLVIPGGATAAGAMSDGRYLRAPLCAESGTSCPRTAARRRRRRGARAGDAA